jgi:hypothetical protein
MNDVYVAVATISDTDGLADELTRTLLRVEESSDITMLRKRLTSEVE